MRDLRRWRCLVGALWMLQTVTARESVFRVRNLQGRKDEWNERQRKLFELELTFSKEGDPIELPIYQLQLFPTPVPLDTSSEMSLEAALGDFIKSYFDPKYPQLEDDTSETTSPQFNSATVDIVDMRIITSETTRRNRNLQRQGTEFDIQTILRFDYGIFPEDSQLKEDMQTVFNDLETFFTDFLPAYTTDSLQLMDSGTYISGFTNPPMTTAPSVAPTGGSPRNTTVSEVNQSAAANTKNGNGLGSIYPALICGVVVFILTALWLSYRRKRVIDFDSDDCSVPIEHISVDFDGRQEALELQNERQLEHQRQQEILEQYENKAIAERLRASRQKNRNRSWHISDGIVQTERMDDGRTTIHITPEMPEDEDDDDDHDEFDMRQSNRRNPERPMILEIPSSTDESSYTGNGRNVFCTSGTMDYVSDSTNTTVRYPSEHQQNSLPSMSKGGTEFGRIVSF